jgi:hypothetical protein
MRDGGFQGSGQDFHRRYDSNWAAVNFQRNRYSTAAELKFTVNLGTASAVVLEADRRPVDLPVREVDCHWRLRIGGLLAGGRDTWWSVSANEGPRRLDGLAAAVVPALKHRAIPELERMASDAEILRATLGGKSFAELSPFEQDIVGPILSKSGPEELFAEYMRALDAGSADLVMYEVYAQYPPRVGPARTARLLDKLATTKSFEPRSRALHELAFAQPSAQVVAAVQAGLDDADPYIRFAAAFAAGRVGDARAVPRLTTMIERDPRHSACSAAVGALRLAPRIDQASRDTLKSAIAARHEDAVGHDRPLLGHVLRQFDTMPA